MKTICYASLVGLLAIAAGPGCAGGPSARLPQLSAATPAALPDGRCEALPAALASWPATQITAAALVPAGTLTIGGQPVAEHCRVAGKVNERTSPVDGRVYAISFEMRLPRAWNGRFFHQGNGGLDGTVQPAVGASGGGPLTHALQQGFAVLSSDAGHAASLGPLFGLDPQARLDYGYQAVATLTPLAKQLIAVAYGKGPDRSYFGGCSNGGRHTFVAAARQAQAYDGYLAGAPGYRLPLAALANIWGAQRYASVATADPSTPPGLETAFTAAERRTVAAAVLARCDALDGATDGLVQASAACQAAFKPLRDLPTCSGARDGSCLSVPQQQVLAAIAGGARRANGEPFYAPFPWDAGVAGSGIAFWEFTASLALDSGSVGLVFKTPPEPSAATQGAAFSLGLDIDATLAQLYARNATYTESGMEFMTPPQATELNDVRRRGAKMLVYHGISDPIFSVADTEAWYRGVEASSGGRAEDFVRLYTVPGMGHCGGGPSTDQVDFLGPLVAWVEQGQAPGALVASARGPGNPGGVNADVPATWAANRTRPLCPFPAVARYRGQGDVENAASWSCRAPERRH